MIVCLKWFCSELYLSAGAQTPVPNEVEPVSGILKLDVCTAGGSGDVRLSLYIISLYAFDHTGV